MSFYYYRFENLNTILNNKERMEKKILIKQGFKKDSNYFNSKIIRNNNLSILDDYKLENNLKKHMVRVSEYSELISTLIGLDSKKIKLIKQGALLHDIGKKKIDNKILNKPFKLTIEEFEIMKKHSELGLSVLNKTHTNNIIENTILFHHEKWNGEGYPFKLKGKNIPIEARIVSIADYYDALTSDRIYKDKISHEKALEMLKNENKKSFDPDIIKIFINFERHFRKILEKYDENKR